MKHMKYEFKNMNKQGKRAYEEYVSLKRKYIVKHKKQLYNVCLAIGTVGTLPPVFLKQVAFTPVHVTFVMTIIFGISAVLYSIFKLLFHFEEHCLTDREIAEFMKKYDIEPDGIQEMFGLFDQFEKEQHKDKFMQNVVGMFVAFAFAVLGVWGNYHTGCMTVAFSNSIIWAVAFVMGAVYFVDFDHGMQTFFD